MNLNANTTDVALKAPLASPALIGTATAVNLSVSGKLIDGTTHVLTSDNCDLTKDMFIKLMNDNQEMMKIIKEQQQQLNTIIPKIGGVTNNTTNNHFNLNLF